MNDPITAYLARLADQLDTPPAARAAFLEEAHSHLTERVAHLVASGQTADAAATQAIAEFGDASTVGARITAVHPAPGQPLRHRVGLFVSGLLLAPLIWLLVAYPFVWHLANEQHVLLPGYSDVPSSMLEALWPQTGRSVDQVFMGGWTQLIVLLIAQTVVPFWWGSRVRHATWSWLPSVLYGLGALLGLGWALLPTWFIAADHLPQAHHYTLASAVALGIAGLVMLSGYAGFRLRNLVNSHRAATTRSMRSQRIPGRSLSWMRLGVVVPLVLTLVVILEGASFLQARAETSQPQLPLTRRLALAQGHVKFPVRTPHILPTGMSLTDLLVHPLYDFHYGYEPDQFVWLEYQAGADSLIIRENCYVPTDAVSGVYCAPTKQSGYQPGPITPLMIGGAPGFSQLVPPDAVEGTGFDGSELRQTNVFFTLHGVLYQVASNTLTVNQLVAVAISLAQ